MNSKYIFFFMFCFIKTYSQAENNNWYFGQQSGLSFLNNSATVLLNNTITNQFSNGCGTVSDKVTGQLLFSTDGLKVYDKNFNVTPNTVTPLSGLSSIQSGLIVPSIQNRKQFYIFTTSYYPNFYYSVVDMSLNNGLGDVVLNQKSISLYDENSQNFQVRSMAVTVVPNNLGNAYWILYPNNNKLYSYKLDVNGINPIPVVSNLTFTNNQSDPSLYLNSIKVSPDNSRIGINYTGNYNTQNNTQLRIYNFNSATGLISVNNEISIIGKNIKEFEFSPNSQIVFYSSVLYPSNCLNCYNSELICHNIVSNVSRIEFSTTGSFYGNFQRTISNDIFFNKNDIPRNLYKFNDANNYFTTISNSILDCNPDYPNPIRYASNRLPQLIPSLNCLNYEILNGNNINQNFTYQTSNYITSSGDYTINDNQNINLFAGNYIELKNNTLIKSGSNTLLKIQGCMSNNNRVNISNAFLNEVNRDNEQLFISPNPSNEIVSVKIKKNNIIQCRIFTLENKLIKTEKVNVSKEFELNISDLSKGIYILTIETDDGRFISHKLIKN